MQGSTHIARTLPGLRAHNCRAYSNYYHPRLGLTNSERILHSQTHNTSDLNQKLPSILKALIYLYLCMVRGTWVGRLAFYYFTLFLGGQPFDSTHYSSRSMHFAEPLQYCYPKLWALSPKTVTRGIHYPTGPQHNHRDSS